MKPKTWYGAAVGIAVLVAAAGLLLLKCAGGDGAARRADPSDAGQVAPGAMLYSRHCAACHGAHLDGQPNWRQRKPDGRLPAPPHDATGHTWHHPDQVLFQIVELGLQPPLAPAGYESDMPAFGDTLENEEIWAVLTFIKSKWPPEIRERQARVTVQSERR